MATSAAIPRPNAMLGPLYTSIATGRPTNAAIINAATQNTQSSSPRSFASCVFWGGQVGGRHDRGPNEGLDPSIPRRGEE